MTPQAGGSNNTLTTQGSQTLRFDDLADTGGVVGASNSVTSTLLNLVALLLITVFLQVVLCYL